MFTQRALQNLRPFPISPLLFFSQNKQFSAHTLSNTRAFASRAASMPVHTTPLPLRKRPVNVNPDLISDHAIISYKGNKDIKPTYFSTLSPNSLPKLTKINLSSVSTDANDLNNLFKAAPDLEYLNIDWNRTIQPHDIANKVSTKAQNLKYLKCMETNLNSHDIQRLFLLCPKLEKVSLHSLENINAHDFVRLNLAHANIHELSLFGTKVTADDIAHIISHFPQLKKLGLTRCPYIDSHDIIDYKEQFPHIKFV